MTDLEARFAKLAAAPKGREDQDADRGRGGRKPAGSRDVQPEGGRGGRERARSASEDSPKRAPVPKLSFGLKKKEKCSVQDAFEAPEVARSSKSSMQNDYVPIDSEPINLPRKERIAHPSESGPRTVDNRDQQPRDGGRYNTAQRKGSPSPPPRDSTRRHRDQPAALVDEAEFDPYAPPRDRRGRSRSRERRRSPSPDQRREQRVTAAFGAGNIEEFARRPASKRNIGAHSYNESTLGGGRRKHEIVPTTSVMPIFSNNPSDEPMGKKPKKGEVPEWLQDLVDRPKKEEFERPKVPYKEIHIPYNLLARVIGRGGEIIQSIHLTSGCKISLHQEAAAHSGMVVCILTGSDAAMNSAEHLIHQRVGGGDSGVQTKELHIPSDRVSAVIGPRAAILAEIRHRSGGLRVEIQPPDLAIIGPGSMEQLLVAEALIMTRVEGKPLRCCPPHLAQIQMPAPVIPENSPFQINQSPFIMSQPPPKPVQPLPAVARDALFEDVD